MEGVLFQWIEKLLKDASFLFAEMKGAIGFENSISKLSIYTQINKASNSIDIALGANVKVPGGFTLVVKEYGVEVQGVTNWNNQKESQDASDMAGALATLLRNASGQLQHVGTDSRQITQWNEDVEKVLGYFGIDTSKDFTVNGVKYTREGSAIHKAIA